MNRLLVRAPLCNAVRRRARFGALGADFRGAAGSARPVEPPCFITIRRFRLRARRQSAREQGSASPVNALEAWNSPRLPSIGGRQSAHDELDPVVGELAPRFDLGHVGRLGVALEPFARLRARFAARQAKGLPSPGAICARGSRARSRRLATRAARSIGFLVWLAIAALLIEEVSAIFRRWGVGNCVTQRIRVIEFPSERARQAAVDEGEAERDQRESEELARQQPLVRETTRPRSPRSPGPEGSPAAHSSRPRRPECGNRRRRRARSKTRRSRAPTR